MTMSGNWIVNNWIFVATENATNLGVDRFICKNNYTSIVFALLNNVKHTCTHWEFNDQSLLLFSLSIKTQCDRICVTGCSIITSYMNRSLWLRVFRLSHRLWWVHTKGLYLLLNSIAVRTFLLSILDDM